MFQSGGLRSGKSSSSSEVFRESSCQDLWTFLPEGCGSGRGIASVEFDTEEFTDGHDLAATAAFATDADVSAPKVAGATPSLPEKAFLAA